MIDLSNRLEPHLGEIGSICTKTGANDEDRNTGDTIYRQAAIDAVNDCGICIQKIVDLPSAQLDRKKGKWIEVDPHMVICPFCKHASSRKNFCAECGADMRGEEDENKS